MAYDLVIRDGTIVDGFGLSDCGDLGISQGRIAAIGKITESAN